MTATTTPPSSDHLAVLKAAGFHHEEIFEQLKTDAGLAYRALTLVCHALQVSSARISEALENKLRDDNKATEPGGTNSFTAAAKWLEWLLEIHKPEKMYAATVYALGMMSEGEKSVVRARVLNGLGSEVRK